MHIQFYLCNLDQASVQLLANAVNESTCIGGFTCRQNPFNFPDGERYDPSTDEPVKQAIIASKAPITMWNGKKLPQDMVEARRQKAFLLEVIQALTEFGLDAETSEACASALQEDGFDSMKKLARVEDSDLAEAGIENYAKLAVLSLKASLNPSKPGFTTDSMPPLPSGINCYAFMAHNWGEGYMNHKRVQGIVNAFSTKGWPMWFDDERLTGHVGAQITKGIDASATFVVFITKVYVEKVANGTDKGIQDWCLFEFNYATLHKSNKMIAVVMEKEMLDQTEWKGIVGGTFGRVLYIDYTSEDKFASACNELAKAIAGKIATYSPPQKKSRVD
ncbi:hypothetical protein BASA81_001981 [Batrachochytrium salamandrivorans]|nr:hypothetical protein BASA81_001981 [Batrachochytrium salamandrivorans]